jgi:cold shock CspA family protein
MSKRQRPDDPFAEREAQKYENPIPSREMIMEMLGQQDGPTGFKRLAKLLNLETDDELEALRRRMRAMERDGQALRNRRDSFGLASKMQLVSGRVIGHPDGYGFLKPDEGSEDLFLSAKQMRPLLHGDRVMVRVSGIDRRGRREGAVVEVLERSNNEVVGRFHLEHGVGFVIPDNKRITQDILVSAECNRPVAHNPLAKSLKCWVIIWMQAWRLISPFVPMSCHVNGHLLLMMKSVVLAKKFWIKISLIESICVILPWLLLMVKMRAILMMRFTVSLRVKAGACWLPLLMSPIM